MVFQAFLECFHLASLPSCLGRIQERHLCCFLSSSFVKRRFSKREHLLHISTIEHRESRKLGVPRDISLGPRSTASWCLLAAPHTQKMRAYFSATSTQSTTQGGDLLRKRMTYDFFSTWFFFQVPRDNDQIIIKTLEKVLITQTLDFILETVRDTLDRCYQITFRLYCTYKCHLAGPSAKMRVLPP